MTSYIVVEGPLDTIFVRELLKPDFDSDDLARHGIQIMHGGGRSGAALLARSLLAVHRQPTLLVVDADTSDPPSIHEHEEFFEESLGQVASRSLWKILLAAPSMEALLFSDRNTIEALVGHSISDEQLIRGQFVPRQVLGELLPTPGRNDLTDTLAERLEHLDFSALRQTPLALKLKQQVAETLQRVAA